MPLSVNFRWKTPTINVGNVEQASREQGLKDLATGIGTALRNRYQKQQQERRNAIEDEDRTRRMEEEDRRKKAYTEAAEIMRNRQVALDRLRGQREQIVQQIQQLQAELGEQ